MSPFPDGRAGGGGGHPRWPALRAGESTTNASVGCGVIKGLRVPQRHKKKRLTGVGAADVLMSPFRLSVIRAMDFQFDTTADGHTLKMLHVIDESTREALDIHVDRRIDADGVIIALDHLARQLGVPARPRRPRRVPIQQCRFAVHRSWIAVAEHLDRIVQWPSARRDAQRMALRLTAGCPRDHPGTPVGADPDPRVA